MAIKIGLVGIGNVTIQNYLPYLASRQNVTLGLFNRTGEKAQKAAETFRAQAFGSLGEMIDWQPETIFVLTSEMARHAVARQLIQQGAKRLFLEKPLVAAKGQAHVSEQDFTDARELLELAQSRRCTTAMIFNYRFFDQTLAARRVAQERGFGQVIHVSAMTHYACWSHVIDLIHHFAGDISRISALPGQVTRHGQGIQANDITACFTMAHGATGTLLGTSGLTWHHPLYELTLTFEKGRIHLRDLDGEMEIHDAATNHQERWTLGRDGSRWTHYTASFAKSLAAYLDWLDRGAEAVGQPPVPGIDGLKELQVEAAIRRSIAQQRCVDLSSEFPLPPR